MKEQISLWSKYKTVNCISFTSYDIDQKMRLIAATGDEAYVWDFNPLAKETKLI